MASGAALGTREPCNCVFYMLKCNWFNKCIIYSPDIRIGYHIWLFKYFFNVIKIKIATFWSPRFADSYAFRSHVMAIIQRELKIPLMHATG
jgi:hypothetical protein